MVGHEGLGLLRQVVRSGDGALRWVPASPHETHASHARAPVLSPIVYPGSRSCLRYVDVPQYLSYHLVRPGVHLCFAADVRACITCPANLACLACSTPASAPHTLCKSSAAFLSYFCCAAWQSMVPGCVAHSHVTPLSRVAPGVAASACSRAASETRPTGSRRSSSSSAHWCSPSPGAWARWAGFGSGGEVCIAACRQGLRTHNVCLPTRCAPGRTGSPTSSSPLLRRTTPPRRSAAAAPPCPAFRRTVTLLLLLTLIGRVSPSWGINLQNQCTLARRNPAQLPLPAPLLLRGPSRPFRQVLGGHHAVPRTWYPRVWPIHLPVRVRVRLWRLSRRTALDACVRQSKCLHAACLCLLPACLD